MDVQIFGFALTFLGDAHTSKMTMNAILFLSQKGAAASTCWLLKHSRFVAIYNLHMIHNLTEETTETTHFIKNKTSNHVICIFVLITS